MLLSGGEVLNQEEIIFRNIEIKRDLKLIYNAMSLYETKNRTPFTVLNTSSLQEFEDLLRNRLRFFFHDFLIIENQNSKYLGLAFSYDYRSYDGHCKIAVLVGNDSMDDWVVFAEAFQNYLFSLYPLRKLFLEVDDNQRRLEVYRKAGFKTECVLSEYHFCKGTFCDVVIMSKER